MPAFLICRLIMVAEYLAGDVHTLSTIPPASRQYPIPKQRSLTNTGKLLGDSRQENALTVGSHELSLNGYST
ncbi:unnamed protein product, partial [Iphiclides podalirius]